MTDKASNLETSSLSLKQILLRFTAYTSIILICMYSLPTLVQHGHITIFQENGAIEWLQFSCLIMASFIFFTVAFNNFAFHEMSLVLGCFSTFAAIRELDRVFRILIPYVSWKFGYLFILIAILVAFRKRIKFTWQATQFCRTPAFAILWAGFIVSMPIAQLLGHGPLLEALMGDSYIPIYKRVIEESCELAGYLLIIAGTVESMVYMNTATYCRIPQWEQWSLHKGKLNNLQGGLA